MVHHLIGAATKIALTPERLYCHFENPNSVMLSGFDTRWAAGALGALDDRLEFARRENLPRLAAETLARRVYETEYQLVMNRRYNRDKNSRAKFAREMAAKKHLYYREVMRPRPTLAGSATKSTQKSTKLPIKSRIFVVLCRFWPLAYHLYNHLKWPEIAFGEAK